jgi:hypothetical protein
MPRSGAELWVMLLEKAFAKWAGSYGGLKGGAAVRAWIAMTGCTDVQFYEFDDWEGQWVQSQVDTSAAAMARGWWGKKLLRPGQQGFKGEKKLDGETMFAKLAESDTRNYVMAASISSSGGVEHKRPDGLVEGHAVRQAGSEPSPHGTPHGTAYCGSPCGETSGI